MVLYLREADTQCRLAIGAVVGLNNALNATPDNPDGSTNWDRFRVIQGEIFRSVHSLLTHVSCLSRLLWPPASQGASGKAQQRGAALREKLGLADDGHTLKKRTLRDHLEHFDERIDDWCESSVRKNYAQDIVAPRGGISGLEDTDIMRWYDPERTVFTFRGDEFNIQELVASVEELRPLLAAALESIEPR